MPGLLEPLRKKMKLEVNKENEGTWAYTLTLTNENDTCAEGGFNTRGEALKAGKTEWGAWKKQVKNLQL